MVAGETESIVIREGDFVTLLDPASSDAFTAKVVGGSSVNTGHGTVSLSELIGKRFGENVATNHGDTLRILSANFADKFSIIKRGPQIITLKDAALIVAFCGIQCGDRVVEGGSGSGALTSFLANAVASEGRVFSYELRDDFFELARSNVKRLGLADRVTFKRADLYAGIEEKELDAVILDVPEPWQVVNHAREALVPGGMLVSYVPTINQVEKFVLGLGEGFFPPHTFESILRDYKVRDGATRPEFQGLMHTGFITIVKKA